MENNNSSEDLVESKDQKSIYTLLVFSFLIFLVCVGRFPIAALFVPMILLITYMVKEKNKQKRWSYGVLLSIVNLGYGIYFAKTYVLEETPFYQGKSKFDPTFYYID
ncbi:MAG: hypothetical protein JNM24_11600 [Bdellovibrionaceae bacterium]|nr:hypothetical protein [Pseudobdellovibrionaceae bacterium]